MKFSKQIVISASRRTDIPAFYMQWFMAQIEKGTFEITNPYNRRVSIIPATADRAHTIVFWSKNFGPFIKGEFGKKLKDCGYNLFFNFTINSASHLLEPHVPHLSERLDQLEYLCSHFDARSITWRFDPICFYRTENDKISDNLRDFSLIAQKASQSGVTRCITSFMDDYPKIRKRIASIPAFSFSFPSLEKKKEIILKMQKELKTNNISLFTCCEKDLLASLPENCGIRKSSCIPNDQLAEIFGGHLSYRKDAGQRVKQGCGCMTSVDIGCYHLHPCYHNCLFCYANPVADFTTKKLKYKTFPYAKKNPNRLTFT